jgi:hypothetical protein
MWREVAVAYFNALGFLCGNEKDGLKEKRRNKSGKGVFKEI